MSKKKTSKADQLFPLTMSPRTAQLLLDGFKALAWPTAEVHDASRLLKQLEAIAAHAPPAPPANPGA